MRISSTTASLESQEPIALAGQELDALQSNAWQQVKRYFHQLNQLMTAVAHAEAGNLDEVQKILDQSRPAKKSGGRPAAYGRVDWQ